MVMETKAQVSGVVVAVVVVVVVLPVHQAQQWLDLLGGFLASLVQSASIKFPEHSIVAVPEAVVAGEMVVDLVGAPVVDDLVLEKALHPASSEVVSGLNLVDSRC